ncbi:MAG: DnaJ domain-containing protein [Nitrospinales bacterium]
MRQTPKDYYKILRVSESADAAEIKKAYRKLAMEFHPDHNPGDSASEEKFKEITEAYGVLIDPLKRREFDRYRHGAYSGTYGGSSPFDYSQQDIFENLFRNASARQVFEELNREFNRSGFRSGRGFFENIFFGGAAGGLGRLLWMLPGPLGRIGQGIRLVQLVGTSLLALNQLRKAHQKVSTNGEEEPRPLTDSLKGLFGKTTKTSPLDLNFQITLTSSEADRGGKKEISYKVGEELERLRVSIPPGIRSGQKLRIKEKGYEKNGRRGDLVLSFLVREH